MSESEDFSSQATKWSQNDIEDYLDELDAILRQAESNIQALNRQPEQMDIVHALFRNVHSIKSNAAMYHFTSLVEFVSPMEDLISGVRSRAITFVPAIGEAILLTLDRIKRAVPELIIGNSVDTLLPASISQAFRHLAEVGDEADRDAHASVLLKLLGVESQFARSKIPVSREEDIVCVHASSQQQNDLRFFRQLSLRLDQRAPYWEGRTGRLMCMAVQTNEVAGKPADPVQLEAAVYMHDIGMGFLSESIWTKHGRLTDLEVKELRQHPSLGAGILSRMAGWEEAAEIVAQHHEKLDGTGYPNGLKEQEILHGAKLLAILDAFEAMTHERIDRQHKKSVMRAIAELNACDKQFSQQWVHAFNKVVRELIEAS